MGTRNRKNDGRSSDLTCAWLTRKYGHQWEAWRAYAADWLKAQNTGLASRLAAITWFLESYLAGEGLPPEPAALFEPHAALPDLMACIEKTMASSHKYRTNNHIVEFLDWVIARDFSEPDDSGRPIPVVRNPFEKVKDTGNAIETVWNPLPYTYIQELRAILCPHPKGHFSDWTWAQAQTGSGVGGPQGDWFEVAPSRVDRQDPDCVWRERAITRDHRQVTITEMWSPVRAVALLIKLHLPLRTYQVRMLDSGEADTWRYEGGNWVINDTHPFALGTEKAPWQSGVFRRIRVPEVGEVMTGLYVNTNKTADRIKDALDRGYTIPWQHPEVLCWLEKLRNWQEKYNPIDAPTSWHSLKTKHTGGQKSEHTLAAMGENCFLFRDAAARTGADRAKPIQGHALDRLWYRLLKTLEDRVAARGQTLGNRARLRFVKEYDDDAYEVRKTATEFPLHSLRVSLITCYAMEGQVPLPVLAKLLAGHSRLLMTVYYTKITPAMMGEKMAQAQARIEDRGDASLRSFLKNAALNQIAARTVYRDLDSVKAALANRNPLGWEHRHIGLCLAGGNTVRSDEMGTVAGCWNGGELIREHQNARLRVYGPVPHGLENCVRCRWFISDARYLDALRAHFNNLSYRASKAAGQAVELEQAKEALEDARFEADHAGRPFTRQAELQQAEQRYQGQLVEADEYAKDLRACFTLIHRMMAIELGRAEDDDRQKLVAVGALHDIHQPIGLLETDSELWQLSEICEDAELYPEEGDDLRKTPAVEKRSRALNTMLMREGYAPVFMQMDERMQLVMGNALMRAMARQAYPEDWRIEGYRRVAGVIEAGYSLRQSGLLDRGIEALEQQWEQPVVSLRELTGSAGSKAKMEVVRGNG